MKILFIENRYKTKLWEVVGREFEKQGHEIHWIVQNHGFKPAFGSINVMPYPKKFAGPKNYTPEIIKIIKADRGLNYFGVKSDDFIFGYDQKIGKLIDEIQPDIVFGESTLCHELLTIKHCKQRGILYLHPSTCRYPINRFSFYLHDTLVPYGESHDKFSDEDARNTSVAIRERTTLPDYMYVSRTRVSRKKKLMDKMRLTISYCLGERYNTPSPFVKRKLNAFYAGQIEAWEKLAVPVEDLKDEFYVLYPLQLQPEANIDVWGYPNNDQAKVAERILSELVDGEKLIVKPNPKSKYEISPALLELVTKNPDKVIALKHSSKMNDVWPMVDLVVTVTGTVSIECVFDNKPVVMLGQALQSFQKNCMTLTQDERLRPIIELVKSNNFPVLSEDEKIDYLQQIVNTSFRGVNGDGLHNLVYLDDERNMAALLEAYYSILNGVH